jgi:adenylate cyclase
LFQFKNFRTRLLIFLVSLLGIVLGAVFFSVNQANISNARLHLEDALQITAKTFAKSLQDRQQIFTEKIRLLSSDYAFKTVFATRDPATIKSALESYRQRVSANLMMLLTMEGETIANTMQSAGTQTPPAVADLLKQAMSSNHGEASAIQIIENVAYQMVVVPLYTPDPSAWILIGFVIDDNFTAQQREFTHSQVSLLYQASGNDWKIISSTLPEQKKLQLSEAIANNTPATDQVFELMLQDEDYLSLALNVQEGDVGQGLAILQRSLNAALAPYLRLRALMLTLFGIGLAISIVGALVIAQGLSRPIEQLVKTARRIEAGDYSKGVEIKRSDEIGTLGKSFNSMVEGLAERDKVQSLLGKVVSREVADELLNKGIVLGGEEREVSVLFSDIRDFTSLCERHEPNEILDLLNRYLTHMSTSIERHGGVVDKYIGDAIMALFGAPVSHPESPQKAVHCALDMLSALKLLNEELAKEGIQPLAIGIGINTGKVVAGNMGSANRLNYTVIGDGVNLASRIEGLTKQYGVEIIVSQSTRDLCPDIHFRELDLVQVKGKTEPVAIFEPLYVTDTASDNTKSALDQYHMAIAHYRSLEWDEAEKLLRQLLADERGTKVYEIYLTRIIEYRKTPPPADWDGVAVFTHK